MKEKIKLLRQRGRPQKWVFLERLKRQPPKKPPNAGTRILRAVVDVHRNGENHHICHHEQRHQPRRPLPERQEFLSTTISDAGFHHRRRVDAHRMNRTLVIPSRMDSDIDLWRGFPPHLSRFRYFY